MALPREPRQKMINIMYLVLTAILALNVSAEILEAFKTVDRSLINSNNNIEQGNKNLFTSLATKLADPKTDHALAQKWSDNATKVKTLSDALDADINQMKLDLKNAANLKMKEKDGKMVEDFKEDNLDASTRLFETKGEGKKLETKLEDYKKQVLAIDPEITNAFINNFPVEVGQPIVGNDGKTKDFTTAYFHMTPTVAALTILSKFQNNIKNAENQVVTFCHSKIGEVVVHLDQVGALVGQSSNYLMPGQELTVTAGVGAYSSSVKSSISINGSPINLVQGQGEYKTLVSGSGSHTIEVNGSFTGEDGKVVPIHKTITYVVGTPGGAAVMLDKMNVFYIGVPNPVSISSGTGWDKTHVSMTGGTITPTGTPGKFTVTVSNVGAAQIIVDADGKKSPYDFRVKRIPDPVIKVGPYSGGKAQAVIFRSQQFVRADLENFDFEAHFDVVGAEVYFNDPNVRNVQKVTLSGGNLGPAKAIMDKLPPGSSVIFDNIRVKGPDGVIRTILNPPGFALF